MKDSRRDFVKASIAFVTLTVTKAIAQPGSLAPVVVKKNIGLLVSTKQQAKHEDAFQQALTTQGWDSSKVQIDPKRADDDYNVSTNQTLKDLAGQHVTKADLIVAAGGLPTATAVAWAVTNYTPKNLGDPPKPPPFIFLIGRYPTSNSGIDAYAADLYNCDRAYKVGGVDQAVPTQNQGNFQLLEIKSTGAVTIDTVGIIVNNNNPITPPELDAWNKLKDPTNPTKVINPNFIYPITDANNQNQGIANLLTKIRTNPQPNGIVVSSDAYLREVGNKDLDSQLRDMTKNKSGHFKGWVCYPYQEYARAKGANSIYSTTTPALATGVPTDPMAAYYILGLTAATVLDQLAKSKPLNAGLTTWSGSAWGSPDLNFH